MTTKRDEEMKVLLQLAARYLNHPDVAAMHFALPSQAVAERIQRLLNVDDMSCSCLTNPEASPCTDWEGNNHACICVDDAMEGKLPA